MKLQDTSKKDFIDEVAGSIGDLLKGMKPMKKPNEETNEETKRTDIHDLGQPDLTRWGAADFDTIDRYGFNSGPLQSREAFAVAGMDAIMAKSALVLEIAPLASPLLPSAYQGYRSIDVTDYEGLLLKYENDANVDKAKIIKPTWVWRGETYSALMEGDTFALVIASHVIEHTPDLIGFLRSIHSVLADDGEVRLIIPDYRYCFDWARSPSTFAQIIAAHAEKRTKPSLENVYDFFAIVLESGIDNRAEVHWSRSYAQRAAMAPKTPNEKSAKIAQHALERAMRGEYVNVHVWRFTPNLFAAYMQQLEHEIGLTLTNIVPTQPNTFEFRASFRKMPTSEIA